MCATRLALAWHLERVSSTDVRLDDCPLILPRSFSVNTIRRVFLLIPFRVVLCFIIFCCPNCELDERDEKVASTRLPGGFARNVVPRTLGSSTAPSFRVADVQERRRNLGTRRVRGRESAKGEREFASKVVRNSGRMIVATIICRVEL